MRRLTASNGIIQECEFFLRDAKIVRYGMPNTTKGGYMKRTLSALAVLAVTATYAGADVVAPDEVVTDEYGGIAVSLSGKPGDVDNGRVLMNKGAGNCIACHEVTALSDLAFHGNIGPSLDGAADRWTEADLRGIVANAKNVFPDTMMPSCYKVDRFIRPGEGYTAKAAAMPLSPLLTAQEVEDLVAFLMTLKDS